MTTGAGATTIGVLICSCRRPEALARCLDALAAQERRPDDVTVVAQRADRETLDLLLGREGRAMPIHVVAVERPGTVHALNAGLGGCRTDILAITDDDTVPRPDWLRRILEHFVSDPELGALGGRDRCHDGTRFDDRQEHVVGRVQWFGRTIGNHHLGFGPAREVHNLKGANMSYRARAFAALRFDTRLRGAGAQPHEDLSFSLAVGRAGWKIRYDPAVMVEHYTMPDDNPRHYARITSVIDPQGHRVSAYNMVLALWDELSPPRRVAFVIWSLLIGTGARPGLVQAFRYTPSLGLAAWYRFAFTQQGKAQAYRDLLGRSPRAMRQGATGRASSSPPQ